MRHLLWDDKRGSGKKGGKAGVSSDGKKGKRERRKQEEEEGILESVRQGRWLEKKENEEDSGAVLPTGKFYGQKLLACHILEMLVPNYNFSLRL